MKTLILILSSAALLFAFGDRSQNSFSQQLPKAASPKAKVNMDSARLVSLSDSLRLEFEKTKVLVAETEKISKESKQVTKQMLINKSKNIAVKELATQTLREAVFKADRMPMHFNVHPIHDQPERPIVSAPVVKDTAIIKKKKRFRWPWK